MIRYRTLLSSVLVASSLVFLATPTIAAPKDCGPMARGDFMEHRAERMEQHHNKLHAALKLTAEQEGSWKKMMDSERPVPKDAAMSQEDWAKLSTPERADKMLERSREHLTQQTGHVAALKDFYAVLTPEQKRTFDESHAAPQTGMRGKHRPRAATPAKVEAKP